MPTDLEEPEAEEIMAMLVKEDKTCKEKRSLDEKKKKKCNCGERNPNRDGKREVMHIGIQCSPAGHSCV